VPQHFQGSLRPLNAVVFERRCAIYTQAANLISDFEDLFRDDGLRRDALSRHPGGLAAVLGALRRVLRGNLAFLDRDVTRELERLETALGAGFESPELLADLQDRIGILHLRLGGLLQSQHGLYALSEIREIDPRLEQRLADEARLEQVQARAQALGEECSNLEGEARSHIANEDFARAAKALRRAIRIDPRRAVLRNDLGVVLSLLGKTQEAAAEYRAAIALNEQEPARRTEEWTTSYYNLGVALRKLAQITFRAGESERGRETLRSAGEAFHAFRQLQPSGAGQARVGEAEQALAEIERRLGVSIPETSLAT
jgi:tetratricopeptide (TPR) repeat protein